MDEKWLTEFNKGLEKLTENDAGYCNENRYRAGRGFPPLTLEEYKMLLRYNERDCQQMIEQGR